MVTAPDSPRPSPFFRAWMGKALLTTLFLVAAGAAVLVEYLAHLAVQIPHEKRNHVVTAAELSPDVKDVTTTTPDGLKVSAWWWPVAHEEGAPVILVHGLGGTRADMWRALKLVHGLGRNALAIDLRAHGVNAPGTATFGWHERLDVESWIDWLQAQESAKTRPVLWGYSMGAVTCLLAASEDSRVAGVIADAPYDNLRHSLARHAAIYLHVGDSPLLSLIAWRAGAENDFPVDQLDCVRAVRKIHVPVLLIAGELDQRMPPSDVRRIYDAANEPKMWFVVEKAGHSWRPFHPDFCAAVTAYLQQSASPSPLAGVLPKSPNLK